MRQRILAGIILGLTAATSVAAPVSGQGTWETTLQGRAPVTPSGTDYQAYFDTALNITWAADAKLSQTSGYDSDGIMTWTGAQAWIDSLNAQNGGLGYLGASNWRLPTVTDTGASGCVGIAYTGTDCGFNVDLSTGEMAHMHYSTLGNNGDYDTSGSHTGCSQSYPFCLTNTGPFSNRQPDRYWYGTASGIDAWYFSFYLGFQSSFGKSNGFFQWAVRDGDISPVPIPAAAWLLGSALGVLGWIKRKSIS